MPGAPSTTTLDPGRRPLPDHPEDQIVRGPLHGGTIGRR